MIELKETLNLPTTGFPMKANLVGREPQLLKKWEDHDVYHKIRDLRAGQERFVLHDGPPYANGHLHMGHALNKILKDLVIKSKSLSGYDAPYVPGWDCHGLPIELNVEKKIGKAGIKVSVEEFREKCRKYAQSQIDIQRDEFKRLGILGQWDKPYVTMDFKYEANVVRALAKIIENGHLEQGFKPVHWCIDCASSLAEAEVDYELKTSPQIYVAFFAKDAHEFLEKFKLKDTQKEVIIPIWTTTPWTLPANEAVSLNAAIDYVLVSTQNNYFLLAKDLLEDFVKNLSIENYTEHGVLKGKEFENVLLKHPFNERFVPIVLGEHVTTEAGTGAVHTAPAHGPDDYKVGVNYNLPLINPVKANGCFDDDVEYFQGISVFKANPLVINILKEKSTLLHEDILNHSYPHCWRHKTPVIFRATPQWFISMDKANLRNDLLKSIDKVSWIPDWGKARIKLMIENRPDWCISRQRAWGTPIPLFVHNETHQLHPDTLSLMEKAAILIEKDGIDGWFNLDAKEFLGEDAKDYYKINDTLDVWFDSGVSHFAVLKQDANLSFPAQIYLEGSDQHRGWFNSSLTTSIAMYGVPPYESVLTHGYTVDSEGKKLSKSKGNYVELDKLVKQYGADILRLWVSSTDYKNEVSISEEIIKRTADAYRRIRNTARFLLANLFDFDPGIHLLPADKLIELDKWILKKTQLLQNEIVTAYGEYQFHNIYQKIHNFCTLDLGSFYLDIIKDRQYTTPKNSLARRSCQTAMYHIIEALTRWLAPILSFTAEEIWQFVPGERGESIFLEKWYDAWPNVENVDLKTWEIFKVIRAEVNKSLEIKRKEAVIGSALEASVKLYVDDNLYSYLSRLGKELKFLLITSEAHLLPLSQLKDDTLLNHDLKIGIEVVVSQGKKCIRCWHRCIELNEQELCERCVGNINNMDEVRQYV